MGMPQRPVSVKLIVGVLTAHDDALDLARSNLEVIYGPIDYTSIRYEFSLTNYYEAEMGSHLGRWFWSFKKVIDPGELPEIKLRCNQIESDLAIGSCRVINLDPGYLDFHKFILASVKERAQKIYLSEGIYADPTLYFLKGDFHHYDWTLPDFKDRRYNEVFHSIRKLYRDQMKPGLD